jgi:hypothetical protein
MPAFRAPLISEKMGVGVNNVRVAMVTLLSSTNSAQYTQGQEHDLQKWSCIRIMMNLCMRSLAKHTNTPLLPSILRERILASQQGLTH